MLSIGFLILIILYSKDMYLKYFEWQEDIYNILFYCVNN
jgi:hypothetical protein